MNMIRLGVHWREVDKRLGSNAPPELLSVSQSLGVVPRSSLTDRPVSATDLSKYKVCEPSDLVLNRFNAYRGSLGVARQSGIVSPDYLVVRPAPGVSPTYLEYLLRSQPLRDAMTMSMGGIGGNDPDSSGFARIDTFALHRTKVRNVGGAEQRAIADFLDRETALIDALIEKQNALIERLRERRAESISHAVRMGADRDVALRSSQIPWIKQFPAHWATPQLRRIARFTSGAGFPLEMQGLPEERYPFYKVNALGRADADGVIRDKYDTISGSTAELLRASIIPAGSLVLAKIGAALLLGRIRVLDYDSCVDNNMLAVSPRPGIASRFLFYALQDVRMDLLVNPGAVPSLSEKWFRAYQIPLPPLAEQRQIADHLDRETGKIDALIAKVERHIQLARERRSALITAAVTGRIDVGA